MTQVNNYVQILKESLEKKLKILDEIADYNSEQKKICQQERFDIEAYDKIVEAKDKLADEITLVDDGFTLVYDRVREAIQLNREAYKDDIQLMQGYISEITEKISGIQAEEKRIFEMAKGKLEVRRQEMATARKNNQLASNYYKSMGGTSYEPQFMDKKK